MNVHQLSMLTDKELISHMNAETDPVICLLLDRLSNSAAVRSCKECAGWSNMCRNVEKKNDLLAEEIASLEKELEKLEEALRELDPEHELLCNSNT